MFYYITGGGLEFESECFFFCSLVRGAESSDPVSMYPTELNLKPDRAPEDSAPSPPTPANNPPTSPQSNTRCHRCGEMLSTSTKNLYPILPPLQRKEAEKKEAVSRPRLPPRLSLVPNTSSHRLHEKRAPLFRPRNTNRYFPRRVCQEGD